MIALQYVLVVVSLLRIFRPHMDRIRLHGAGINKLETKLIIAIPLPILLAPTSITFRENVLLQIGHSRVS